MRSRRAQAFMTLPILLTFSGCGYVHVGRLPVSTPATRIVADGQLSKENSDLRLEKKMLQQELALTRAQGDALRMAIENRTADGDTSKRLVDQLNQTSREMATLRANYAQLQLERNQAVASAAEANDLRNRLGATEEKLADALRTYTELQGDVTRLRSDVDQARTENVVLTEKVRTVTAQSEEAQAALAQLNTELLSQKDARLRAEQDAQTLRTELANIAPDASVLARERTGAAAAASSLIAEHAAETAALKEQLNSLLETVQNLTAERTRLNDQLTAAAATLQLPASNQPDVESRLATALRGARMLRDENEQLKAVSSEWSSTKVELESQLSQLRAVAAGNDAQSLRAQLQAVQFQAAALTEENARLTSRLTGAAPGAAGQAAPTPPAASQVMITPLPSNPRPASGVNATLVMNVPGTPRPTIVRNPATGDGRFHVVTGGDTLAKISNQYYGTPARWGDILAANRDVLGENNNLVVGRTLRIP